MLILKEIAKFFSKVVVPFYFLTNKIQERLPVALYLNIFGTDSHFN